MPKSSRSKRAGITFPVARIERHLRQGRYASRFGSTSSVYLAAVLEYLTAEVMELSGNVAQEHKRTRITPRAIQLAVRADDELDKVFRNVWIPSAGVPPHIHEPLLVQKTTPKKSKGSKRSTEKSSSSAMADEQEQEDSQDE